MRNKFLFATSFALALPLGYAWYLGQYDVVFFLCIILANSLANYYFTNPWITLWDTTFLHVVCTAYNVHIVYDILAKKKYCYLPITALAVLICGTFYFVSNRVGYQNTQALVHIVGALSICVYQYVRHYMT